MQWQKNTIIAGTSKPANQRAGPLFYLDQDERTPLFTLTFKNLGVFKLTPDKVESHSDQIRRIKVEMYCESMNFDYGRGSTAA